jgi:hypothetical protein
MWNLGESFLEKVEIGESSFWEKTWKISPLAKFIP